MYRETSDRSIAPARFSAIERSSRYRLAAQKKSSSEYWRSSAERLMSAGENNARLSPITAVVVSVTCFSQRKMIQQKAVPVSNEGKRRINSEVPTWLQ